jgi:hypothetical protein
MIFVIACVMVLMAGPTQASELDDPIKRLDQVCGVPTFACQEACRSPADLAVTAIKAMAGPHPQAVQSVDRFCRSLKSRQGAR